jgi:hypothetical protein
MEGLTEEIEPQGRWQRLHQFCAASAAPLVPMPGNAPKRAALL